MEREQFLKSPMQRIITECLRHLHDGKCLEYVTYREECCSTLCSQAVNSTYSFDAIKEVIEILRDVYLKKESVISDESIRITEKNVEFSGAPGRPKFDISEEILIDLKDHDFKVQLIAKMLNVIKKAVFRHSQEFSLSAKYNDRNMSNDELDRKIRIAAREFPFYGIRRRRGYLILKGTRVSWQRIRESMWQVSPDDILFWSLNIQIIEEYIQYQYPFLCGTWMETISLFAGDL